jgi:hypothetical protein
VSYTFEWLVQDRVLKVLLPFAFDDGEAQKFDTDVLVYLDQASQPIHLVLDVRQVKTHPSMKTFFGWKHLKHPNLGYTMMIGMASNPVVRFMAGIVVKAVGVHLKDVESDDEALAHLAIIDSRLKDQN